jgi:hypothetical protein
MTVTEVKKTRLDWLFTTATLLKRCRFGRLRKRERIK